MLLVVADCDENVSLSMLRDGHVLFQIIPLAQEVISYQNKSNVVSWFVFGLVTGYCCVVPNP